ncbi:cytochrome c [Pseudomonas sp. 5Ae-yellow]|uniref:c-type cytochrome n=1 Tax=Pseudomonas sp. 5Ae-yellow TaxID=2759848 RepID=UPI0015F65BAE|nr:cytochrome c [Pseudomonas sp. 5Ae-yellow]MBA6420857.1 cytochrome c [Pseudomonas sp. 5Ae-yellow]
MKSVITTLLGGTLLVVSLSAAAAQLSPEDQIETRKAGFTYMAWNMGKIKAQVIDESVEYNPEQVSAAANAIAAIANSGMGALFGPGTDQDVGKQVTRADPALFANMNDMAELAGNLGTASDNLVAAAATGDASAVRVAFGEVGKSCKACHDKYRLD